MLPGSLGEDLANLGSGLTVGCGLGAALGGTSAPQLIPCSCFFKLAEDDIDAPVQGD